MTIGRDVLSPGREREREVLSFGPKVMDRLDALARHSEDAGALTRRFLTPEHRAAGEQVRAWMEEAGMAAGWDAIGNVVGRYEGVRPGLPALLLGSHIDTVRDAGRYDGNLGVVAAIACVEALDRRGARLPFAIEVLAFGDEEGVRFPTTLLGSRAVAGMVADRDLDVADETGITVRDALRAFGADPAGVPAVARRPDQVLGYVELHIEQGPVLEAEDLPVGIVTAIAAASRFTVEMTGMAGHAGTVPMGLRRDALAAAAEAVLAVERRCTGIDGLVGTVGRIAAAPGAVNVIPGGTTFSMDIRAAERAVRDAAVADIVAEIEAIGRLRGIGVEIHKVYDEDGCRCDPGIMDRLERAVATAGLRPRRLPSGAGHDAMALAGRFPVGMLFVRCRGGISHNPAESITIEDADAAVRVLLNFIEDLANGMV